MRQLMRERYSAMASQTVCSSTVLVLIRGKCRRASFSRFHFSHTVCTCGNSEQLLAAYREPGMESRYKFYSHICFQLVALPYKCALPVQNPRGDTAYTKAAQLVPNQSKLCWCKSNCVGVKRCLPRVCPDAHIPLAKILVQATSLPLCCHH